MAQTLKLTSVLISKTIAGLGCMAGIGTTIAIPALAGYTPPPDSSAPRSETTTTTVVRGGCRDESGSMVILAPRNHVGQTISTQPTVSWFIPDEEPFAMELRLYEQGSDKNFVFLEMLEMTTTPGWMQASLPVTQPGLEPGGRYLWEVVVFCDPNRPAGNLIDRVEMEVVDPPADLAAGIPQAITPQDQAELYAEAGLWYDALAQVITADNPEAVTYRNSLLQALAESEHSSSNDQTFSEAIQELLTP
jgi:hypothetical protein